MASIRENIYDFSHNGKLFAYINTQGILEIWDTESNKLAQEYKPNLHLAGACTALTWIVTTTKDDMDDHTQSDYLVLGNGDGHLSLYSYTECQLVCKLKGDGHTGKVTSITTDSQGNIYSCGEDSKIIVWLLSKKEQKTEWSIGSEKPFSLLYLPKSHQLVIGARQILVYDINSQKLLKTFIGQASDVLYLRRIYMDREEYILSACRMDRNVCVWKLDSNNKNKTPFCTLVMEDLCRCLSCCTYDDTNIQVLSVTKSGVLHIFLMNLLQVKADKPLKPKVTLQVISNTNGSERISVLAATNETNHLRDNVLYGYGDKRFLTFEYIKVDFSEKVQLLVREHPKNALKKRENTEDLLKINAPIIKNNEVDFKTSVIKKKKSKVSDMPLEKRIKNLESDAINGVQISPDSNSKVHLLQQALQSKDENLINTVLCVKDTKVIDTTVRRLPIGMIGDLVDVLTKFMEGNNYYLEFAILWLKSVLNNHMSHLTAMSKEDLLDKFGPCIGIINYRESCLSGVSSACGRLQILMSQVNRNIFDDTIDASCPVYNFDNNTDVGDINDGNMSSSSVSDDDLEEMELDNDNDIY